MRTNFYERNKTMGTNFFLLGTKRIGRATAFAFGAAMLFALLLLFGLQAANPAHAATTFTVNFTGDENDLDFPGGVFDGSSDGKCDVDSSTAGDQCTLRAAIQQANVTKGADTINFDIPGTGPHTINVGGTGNGPLPDITKPLTIDGYTQSGAQKNTLTQPDKTNAVLKIELHGDIGTNYCYGLNVAANNVVIRGLVINNFEFCGSANSSSAPGSRLSGTGHRVQGNFIGTNADGTRSDRNATGRAPQRCERFYHRGHLARRAQPHLRQRPLRRGGI